MGARWFKVNKRALMFLSLMLIVIIVSSAVSVNFGSNKIAKKEFYVGVELAYGDFNSLKGLVDQVKDYTNVFVLGLPEFSKNLRLLDESCDYIYNSGLHFIVLFTNISMYKTWGNYTPAQWVSSAMQKYGDKFLGVYRWDEPGGDQIDASEYQLVRNATDYSDAATSYVTGLSYPVEYYLKTGQNVLTADYVLYWFDYQAGYSSVLAEFGWNSSRQIQIALCRGAARANNKDWGAIITWTYSQAPYIESAAQLHDDLLLAYNNGAKYAIVFDYPDNVTNYGILTDAHLNALKTFWTYMSKNAPSNPTYGEVQTAYVLPADYGFGFRSAQDNIWGLWGADNQSQKIWTDVNALVRQYGSNFDIVFNDPEFNQAIADRYDTLIYWNETR